MEGRHSFRHSAAFVLIPVFSWLLANRYLVEIDADDMMISIMSQQHVTMFYWGQDRMLNIISFLVQWVEDPFNNLLAAACISSLSFFLSLYVVSLWIRSLYDDDRVKHWLVFPLLASVTLLLFSGEACTYFMSPGQPYPLAILLFVFYVGLYASMDGMGAKMLAFLVLVLLLAYNPSALIPLAFVPGGVSLARGDETFRSMLRSGRTLLHFLMLGAGMAISILLTWLVPDFGLGVKAYYAITGLYSLTDLAQFCAVSLNEIHVWILAGLLLLGGAGVVFGRGMDRKRIAWMMGWLGLFIVIWLLVISQRSHVRGNVFHARYNTFVFFSLVAMVGIVLPSILRYVKGAALQAVILSTVVVCVLWVPPREMDDLRDVVAVRETMTTLDASGIRFIGGNYWKVWPIIFSTLHSEQDHFVSLAYRSSGNWRTMDRELDEAFEREAVVRMACIEAEVQACLKDAGREARRSFQLRRDYDIGQGITVMELESP